MNLTARPGETTDFGVYWPPRKLGTDAITHSEWLLPADLVSEREAVSGQTTQILLSGFRAGNRYTLLNRITTSSGRVLEEPVSIEVTTRTQGLITPAELREVYLNNLPLEDPQGRPIPDRVLERRIRAAESAFERRYGVRLAPTAVKVGPLPLRGELKVGDVLDDDPARYAPLRVERIEQFRGLDYTHDGNLDHRHHIMRLPLGPVISVRAFGLALPGMKEPALYPREWLDVSRRSHRVQVYARQLTAAPVVHSVALFHPLVPGGKTVPQAWHVSYIAGYRDADFAGPDADVLDALGKLTACDVLVPGSIDRNLALGVQSKGVGVDGLSQNVALMHNAGAVKYQALINAYREHLKGWERGFFARVKGVRLGAV